MLSQVVSDSRTLWAAAANVCAALESGDDAAWARGEADWGKGAAQDDVASCLDRAVYQAIAGILDFHRRNPHVEIQLIEPTGTACPIGFTGISYYAGHGSVPCSPVEGWVRVRLDGRLLGVDHVMVGDTRVYVDRREENTYYFDIPPGEPGTVTVTVQGLTGPLPGSVQLFYVEDIASCPA